jgi:hypothetical protein
MDKIAVLESLGFSKEYINKLEQFEHTYPKIAQIEFEVPITVIDFAPSQDLTIKHDPQTAYSSYTINI